MSRPEPIAATEAPGGAASRAHPIELSIIVPFYNEEGSVSALYRSVTGALGGLGKPYELVFVDDGSTDTTAERLLRLAERDPTVKVIELARNYGQTAAMMAGIDHAAGKVLISMDGDGQNDPKDIPRLLAELEKGFDVVSGWRVDRKDKPLSRRLPSRIANWLISLISGVRLHDYGCSLKAYRRRVLEGVRLYGEMHRFIPIYAAWQGGRITEIAVDHHARAHGRSKYGLERVVKVLLDLLLVRFLEKYLTKPIYLFGGFGLLCFLVGFAAGVYALYLKLLEGVSFILTPLPLLVVLSLLLGTLSLLIGLLAEILVRTYYEAQGKRSYLVRALTNVGER